MINIYIHKIYPSGTNKRAFLIPRKVRLGRFMGGFAALYIYKYIDIHWIIGLGTMSNYLEDQKTHLFNLKQHQRIRDVWIRLMFIERLHWLIFFSSCKTWKRRIFLELFNYNYLYNDGNDCIQASQWQAGILAINMNHFISRIKWNLIWPNLLRVI